MTPKFFAKEIHFLKSGSEDQEINPPEIYYSDLCHSPSVRFTTFEERLNGTTIPDDRCICTLVQIDPAVSEETVETAKDVFEACFNALLNKERGIWERLDDTTFVLVFWDYADEKEGLRLVNLLKDKISDRLGCDLLLGIALYPDREFTPDRILSNALKAFDHAAFFGHGHTVTFDGISLNISGDRLFQLEKYDEAIDEYKLGLAIDPKNINLLNSLGVSYGITDQMDLALETFEQAWDISPEEVMVIYNIGLIHRIKENEDKSILYLKKAHGINPDIFEVELLLGHLLFKQDRVDQSVPHLEAAARLNPASGTPFRSLGQILLDKNEPAAAAAQFNLAVKNNPQVAQALSGYAKAMGLQNKNLSIALSFAKKARDLDPGNPEYEAVLEEIRERHEAQQAGSRDKTIKSA
ncbi:MAG: tetratricopeptide repeat protein [Desulfobacterales bacterium]|nr:tetratricopeptide repeat protein [Desulfobacterales bacterium]